MKILSVAKSKSVLFSIKLNELLKREYLIYYILGLFALIILLIALLSGELTIEMLSVKLINLSLGGGTVYLIKTFDFKGVNFTNEISKNNISAAITFTGICLLVGFVLGAN
ncbi:MAG TPA: hypothetical protein PKW14_11600 [Bacteroidota bacterium]|nr:hypothetical protein [Bacteroidota bacterium]